MKKVSFLKNDSGFSLMSTLAAAAIGSVIMLGITKSIQTGNQGAAKVTTDIDLSLWKQGVFFPEIGIEKVCRDNFVGLDLKADRTALATDTLTPASVTWSTSLTRRTFKALRDAAYPSNPNLNSAKPLLEVGLNIGTGDTWEISNVTMRQFVPDSVGSINGVCKLEVLLDRKRRALGVSSKKVIADLDCSVDNSTDQLLTTCVLPGANNSAIWTDAGDQIFYNGQPVTVGAAVVTPQNAALTISATNASLTPQWPIGSGTPTVEAGILLENPLAAVAWNNTAINENANCLTISNNNAGTATANSNFCFNGTQIASRDSNITAGTQNTILGGSNVEISGLGYNTASGQRIGMVRNQGVAFGSHINVVHDRTFTIGYGNNTSFFGPTNDEQFTGLFSNGFRFYTQTATNGSAASYIAQNNSSVQISAIGQLLVGSNSSPAISDKAYFNGNIRVAGDAVIAGNVSAPTFIYTSDRRLKKNIKTIDTALDMVSKLRGVFFEWKSNDELEMGFIAQEIEKVYPFLVKTNSRGIKGVKYANITAVLVESVKELKLENKKLKLKVDFLMKKYCESNTEEDICQN